MSPRYARAVRQSIDIDFPAWDDHASWWETESPRVRERFSIDEAALDGAGKMFGKIGASTVGRSYQEVLAARRDLGVALGRYAEDVAAHIRRSLSEYAETEQDNTRRLSS